MAEVLKPPSAGRSWICLGLILRKPHIEFLQILLFKKLFGSLFHVRVKMIVPLLSEAAKIWWSQCYPTFSSSGHSDALKSRIWFYWIGVSQKCDKYSRFIRIYITTKSVMELLSHCGLVEPFHLRSVYCLLFIFPDGLGSDRKTGWLWGRLSMVLFQAKGERI